ncbi:MAG: thioredoxin-disulfide reductase [Endomicrobium sp.]|uniref:thioredoxin-disulfide reductase n=1 Tax=Candidatus Endomicrobiellum pyrsonymphae TaxID=1408203 RepID=UPI003589BB72|nr:thioredoxin-disulfide reductase [Endomicrobium sp.]
MTYDAIIIGGGPSGLSAAIYASRARLKTLLVEKNGCGGQMTVTDLLENYPGFNDGINGFDLAVKLETQARDFGTEIMYDEVTSIENGAVKKVITVNGACETKTIIVAAGTSVKKMNIPGEEKFIGRGVSFCAICDAPFYKGKDVAVIGGGDSAIQEAIYLSNFAKNVIVVHRRDTLRATKILQEKMASRANISVIYDSIPKEIFGNDSIEKIGITNTKTNEDKDLQVDGIFVFIGLIPNTLFLSNLTLDKNGYVITDENMNTSIPGIFACGDIRKKQLRQVVTAASDGAQAAVSAQHYIEN